MKTNLFNRVFSLPIDKHEKLVLLALIARSDEVGMVWDTPYTQLTEVVSMPLLTVRRTISRLGAMGLIQYSKGGVYRVLMPASQQGEAIG